EHVAGRVVGLLGALPQLARDARERLAGTRELRLGADRAGGVGGGRRRLARGPHDRPHDDAQTDADAPQLVHVDHPAASSWSVVRNSASSSSTRSGSSPSTVSTTSSPFSKPAAMIPRMLAALTGVPPGRAIVTWCPDAATAWVKSLAGRACSPWPDAIVTVRSIRGSFRGRRRGPPT